MPSPAKKQASATVFLPSRSASDEGLIFQRSSDRMAVHVSLSFRLLTGVVYCICSALYCRSVMQSLRGWCRILAVAPMVLVDFWLPTLFVPSTEGPALMIFTLVIAFLHPFKVPHPADSCPCIDGSTGLVAGLKMLTGAQATLLLPGSQSCTPGVFCAKYA